MFNKFLSFFEKKERKKRKCDRVDLVTGPILEHTVEPRKILLIFTFNNLICLIMDKFNSGNVPRCPSLLGNTTVL